MVSNPKKKARGPLLQLVQSLSKQEVRYFKLLAGLQGGSKQYEHLFEAMAKAGDGYNEKQARARLHSAGLVPEKNFPVVKFYLEQSLLRALRLFEEGHSNDSKIHRLFEEGKLLLARRITDAGLKKLQQARKLARDFERFAKLTEILDHLLSYEGRSLHHGLKAIDYMDELYAEKHWAIEQLKIESHYHQLLHRAYVLLKTQNKNRGDKHYENQLKQLSLHPALADTSQATSFFSQLFLYHTKSLICSIENVHPEDALEYYRKIMKLWADYPIFKKDKPEHYNVYLSNYLGKARENRDYRGVEPILQEMENQKPRTLNEQIVQTRNLLYNKFLFYMNTGRSEEALLLTNEIEAKVEELKSRNTGFGDNWEIIFFYNIAILFFHTERFNEALRMIQKILDEYRNSPDRRDIHFFCWVLRQVIYYELGLEDKLENIQYYAEKKLDENARLFEFEEMVFFHLSKLLKISPGSNPKKLFSKFLEDLENKNERYQLIVGREEILIWIKSKLTGRKMTEIVEEENRVHPPNP